MNDMGSRPRCLGCGGEQACKYVPGCNPPRKSKLRPKVRFTHLLDLSVADIEEEFAAVSTVAFTPKFATIEMDVAEEVLWFQRKARWRPFPDQITSEMLQDAGFSAVTRHNLLHEKGWYSDIDRAKVDRFFDIVWKDHTRYRDANRALSTFRQALGKSLICAAHEVDDQVDWDEYRSQNPDRAPEDILRDIEQSAATMSAETLRALLMNYHSQGLVRKALWESWGGGMYDPDR